MRNKLKITFVLLLAAILTTAFVPVYSAEEGKPLTLNIEEAVKLGLENSTALKQVQNEIELSRLSDDRARFLKEEAHDADRAISSGYEQVNAAEALLQNNVIPPAAGVPTALQGKTFDQAKAVLIAGGASSQDAEAQVSGIVTQISSSLSRARSSLSQGDMDLSEAMSQAGQTLSDKLNLASVESFGVDATGDMMTTMSRVSLEVTKASYDIYKNQIAMLIKKGYYDVLKAQKLLEAKQKAMDRAKKQWDFAADSFNEGMKAKDDVLLAEVYYKGIQIEYKNAEGNLKNAFIELKKNMNIPMDTEIKLTDVLADKVEKQNLEEGLVSGMKNRLEMKRALGEELIYISNEKYARQYYDKITFQYKEAGLRKEKAVLNFEKTKNEVEASIRQSYETLNSTGEMLELSGDMAEKARESVDIAEYKYKEGFGAESSLLKKLDLEASAGTIVEVLAAEENLSQVEEKVVEIMYGYNMAKMKYLNDIGKFIY